MAGTRKLALGVLFSGLSLDTSGLIFSSLDSRVALISLKPVSAEALLSRDNAIMFSSPELRRASGGVTFPTLGPSLRTRRMGVCEVVLILGEDRSGAERKMLNLLFLDVDAGSE